MTISTSTLPNSSHRPQRRRPQSGTGPALGAGALLCSLLTLAGCQSKEEAQKPVLTGASFRTWIVPRQFDTARAYRFSAATPPDPAVLSAERVAGRDYDYLVLTYERGARAPAGKEPFTALLQWKPNGVLEFGVLELKLFGDGSGTELVIEGEDVEGVGFLYAVGPISWEGWREITVPLEKPTSFYGVKEKNPVVQFPMQVTGLSLRDVQNRGTFRIVLADAFIRFPWKRPASEEPVAKTEPQPRRRNTRFGIPTSPDAPFDVQRPVETKVRRQGP
ncbi:MAG: hypothetical protein FJ125_17660 [Deltaproteobacteria bacterium]|nr:hypothetical protein [Deltaproteobacteria bacterium]